MEEKKRRRSIIRGILTFLILTALVLFFVYHIDPNIFDILETTAPVSLLLLFLFGFLYSFLEATVCRTIFRDRIPGFSTLNALDITYIGVFGNVVTLAAGSIPMQSLYLYRKGMIVGSGVGLMTLEYIFHKASALLYATFSLCCHWSWIHNEFPALPKYLFISYLLCLIIIGTLVLLCTWEKIRDFALRLIQKLPEKGKWANWKLVWQNNLNQLYTESRKLLQNEKSLCRIMLLNFLKLFVLYTIPYMCIKILGVGTYSLFRIQALSSLMFLISNALPNIAGIGSVEFAFFLVFSACLGEYTMAALLLYRLSTYYFPFFLSVVWVLCIHQKFIKKTAF